MRRKLVVIAKVGAVLLTLGVLILAAGGYALKKKLPPEKIRSLIVDNARRFLKREVKLGGIDLGVIKGLAVTGLEVSEVPDFKAGTLAKVESFQLRVRLLPLLRKSVVVDRVILQGLQLSLARRADGSYNFSVGTGTASSAQPSASAAAALPLSLDVRLAELSDARVDYRDAATGDALSLTDLDAHVEDFSLDGPFSARLSMKTSGKVQKKALSAALEFDGKVDLGDLKPERAALELKKLLVELPEGRATVSGSIKGAQAPQIDLKAELVPKGAQALEASAAGTLGDLAAPSPSLSVRLKTPALGAAALKPFAPAFPEGLSLPPAEVSSEFSLKGDELALKSFSLKTAQAALSASGVVRKIKSGKPEPQLEFSASAAIPALASADLAWLKHLKLAVPSDLRLPAAAVSAQGRVTASDLALKEFALSSAGVEVKASGQVRGYASAKPEPDVSVDAKAALPALAAADVSFLKAFKLPVPAEFAAPPTETRAQFRYSGDELDVKSFSFKTRGGEAAVSASGLIRRLRSPKPTAAFKAAAELKLPELKAGDVALLKTAKVKIPDNFSLPPSRLSLELDFSGESVEITKLEMGDLAGQKVQLKAVGTIRSPLTSPEPSFKALFAKLNLPPLTTADLAFLPGVPEGVSLPALKLQAAMSGGLKLLEIKAFNLDMGSNQLDLSGRIGKISSPEPIAQLTVNAPSFDLSELANILPQTRGMGVAGKGRILGVRGAPGLTLLRAPYEGKMRTVVDGRIEIKGAGAVIEGLKLAEFSTDLTLSEQRISADKISGRIGAGRLEQMDLVILNPTRTPSIQIETLKLDEVNVEELLKAKASVAKAPAPAPAAPSPEAAPAKPFNFRLFKGEGPKIGKLIHSNFVMENLSADCNLTGITPDFKKLNGAAAFRVGAGRLLELDKMAARYAIVKVLAIPLFIMRSIGLFPNLNEILLNSVEGDYAIDDGAVTIRKFDLDGKGLRVWMNSGKIDLVSQKLDLDLWVKVGTISKNMSVCGTIASPRVCAEKEVKKVVEQVLRNVVNQPQGVIEQPLDLLKKAIQGQK